MISERIITCWIFGFFYIKLPEMIRSKHVMMLAGVSLSLFFGARYLLTGHAQPEAGSVYDHEGKSPSVSKVKASSKSPSDPTPGRSNADQYALFGSDGETSPAALKAAGLPASSGELVKGIVQGVLAAAREDMASRVVDQTTEEDKSKGVHVFNIKGDPEKCDAYIEQIRQGLVKQFGDKATDKLMIGLRRSVSPKAFGKDEAVIRIEPGEENSPKRIMIEYYNIDSGKFAGEWLATEDRFRGVYGDTFDDFLSPPIVRDGQ
jgi:hypothetical protein